MVASGGLSQGPRMKLPSVARFTAWNREIYDKYQALKPEPGRRRESYESFRLNEMCDRAYYAGWVDAKAGVESN